MALMLNSEVFDSKPEGVTLIPEKTSNI